MEIFVFLRMQPPLEDSRLNEAIVVELLDKTSSGRAELASKFRTFDAGKAECFAEGDRQRLWAVIEASFGTFAPFNEIVHELLERDILKRHASVRAKIGQE